MENLERNRVALYFNRRYGNHANGLAARSQPTIKEYRVMDGSFWLWAAVLVGFVSLCCWLGRPGDTDWRNPQ